MSDPYEVEASPPIAVSAVPLRFCQKCGSVLDGSPDACGGCNARAAKNAKQVELDQLGIEEKRSLVQAIALYASMLCVSVIGIVMVLAQKHRWTLAESIFEDAAFITVVVIWCAIAFRSLKAPLTRTGPWWMTAIAPLVACITFGISWAFVAALQRFIDLPSTDYLDVYRGTGHRFLMGVVFVCLEPAIFEELAFRGVIFGALRRTLGGDGETILVSAGMFAILHLSPPSFPHLFLMGVALAWLRSRSGSLLPGMVLHFSHNLLCIAVEVYGRGHPW